MNQKYINDLERRLRYGYTGRGNLSKHLEIITDFIRSVKKTYNEMVLSSEIEETLYYSIRKNDRKKIIFSNEKILDNLEAVLNARR